MRIHEYLEIVEDREGRQQVRCVRCGHAFCGAGENYKAHALCRERDPNQVPGRGLASGEQPFHVFQEYICPGCGTLLEVDTHVPGFEGDAPVLWDIQVAPKTASRRVTGKTGKA